MQNTMLWICGKHFYGGEMTKEQSDKCKQIADNYGWDSQCMMVIEECSELIKAICKHQRKWRDCLSTELADSSERTAIIEELADVIIMCHQAEYLLSAEGEVSEQITFKLDRQLKRIEG